MLSQLDLTATLQSIPWFRDLSHNQITMLAEIIEIHQLKKDDFLFFEGEKIDNLYIVLEGKMAVEIYIPTRGNVRIFTAEPLDVLGWASLTPVIRQREDSARALSPTVLLGFRGELLRRLCDQDHDLGYSIMRRLSNIIASRLISSRIQLLDIISGSQVNDTSQV